MSFVQVTRLNNDIHVVVHCCCQDSRLVATAAAGRAQLSMGEATVDILWAVVAVTLAHTHTFYLKCHLRRAIVICR